MTDNYDQIEKSLNDPDTTISRFNDYTDDLNLVSEYEGYLKPIRGGIIMLLVFNAAIYLALQRRLKAFAHNAAIIGNKKKIDPLYKPEIELKRPSAVLITAAFMIPNAIIMGYLLLKDLKKKKEIENRIIGETKYEFMNFADIFKEKDGDSIVNKI